MRKIPIDRSTYQLGTIRLYNDEWRIYLDHGHYGSEEVEIDVKTDYYLRGSIKRSQI